MLGDRPVHKAIPVMLGTLILLFLTGIFRGSGGPRSRGPNIFAENVKDFLGLTEETAA